MKTSFTLKLVRYDDKRKVPLIKEVKNVVEGMNLVQVSERVNGFGQRMRILTGSWFQAKKFVESAPQILKSNMPKDEAEKAKQVLEAVGAVVELE